jgi:uncharacterized membrane protein YgcG
MKKWWPIVLCVLGFFRPAAVSAAGSAREGSSAQDTPGDDALASVCLSIVPELTGVNWPLSSALERLCAARRFDAALGIALSVGISEHESEGVSPGEGIAQIVESVAKAGRLDLLRKMAAAAETVPESWRYLPALAREMQSAGVVGELVAKVSAWRDTERRPKALGAVAAGIADGGDATSALDVLDGITGDLDAEISIARELVREGKADVAFARTEAAPEHSRPILLSYIVGELARMGQLDAAMAAARRIPQAQRGGATVVLDSLLSVGRIEDARTMVRELPEGQARNVFRESLCRGLAGRGSLDQAMDLARTIAPGWGRQSAWADILFAAISMQGFASALNLAAHEIPVEERDDIYRMLQYRLVPKGRPDDALALASHITSLADRDEYLASLTGSFVRNDDYDSAIRAALAVEDPGRRSPACMDLLRSGWMLSAEQVHRLYDATTDERFRPDAKIFVDVAEGAPISTLIADCDGPSEYSMGETAQALARRGRFADAIDCASRIPALTVGNGRSWPNADHYQSLLDIAVSALIADLPQDTKLELAAKLGSTAGTGSKSAASTGQQAGSASQIPDQRGHLNDFAALLSPVDAAELEAYLQDAERSVGIQGAVVIISNLGNRGAAQVADQIYDQWGIGRKNGDNGFVLLFAVDNASDGPTMKASYMRIGQGLRDAISDGAGKELMDRNVTYNCYNARWTEAVQSTIRAVIAAELVHRGPASAAQAPDAVRRLNTTMPPLKALTREAATTWIRTHQGYPLPVWHKCWIGRADVNVGCGYSDGVIPHTSNDELDWLTNYLPLQKAGMLVITTTGEFPPLRKGCTQYFNVRPTSRFAPDVGPVQFDTRDHPGVEYVMWHWYDWDFSEVTGIRFDEEKTRATIEYTAHRINLTESFRGVFPEPPAPAKNEIHVVLYDDGWRMVRPE